MKKSPDSDAPADLDAIFASNFPSEPSAPADEPAPLEREAEPEPRRRGSGSAVLGVYVTPAAVHGVLVRDGGDRFNVVRPFARQRSAFDAEVPDLASATPEGGMADAEGVTIQFGDSSSLDAADLFLGSEFGDLAGEAGAEKEYQTPQRRASSPVVFELKDILDECRAAGHERPPTAFCLGLPDVEYVEVIVADRGEKGKKAEPAPGGAPAVKRDRLLARLAEEYDAPFERERVAFLPMTDRDGLQRFLAVVPTPEESLAESLGLLREQSGMRAVPFRVADAEVPVLVGLTCWAFPAAPDENTAIVRVGAEDTLVILLQGGVLHHTEHMMSVTTFDGPDTICSRVLLQQDVQGIGTVHHVVVLSEERERELVQGFGAFYPEAHVGALREGLQAKGVVPPGSDAALSARALPALGAALRMIMEREKGSPFYDEVNLLPKRLRRRAPRLDLAVAWHTLVTGVLLFLTVLFFIGLYFGQQHEIAEAEARVAAYPEQLELSGPALQAQIDSLQAVHARITRTLVTIDSLLVGSDKWSRGLARTARATASSGAWVEGWSPHETGVRLTGMATTRDQVVQFAERMDASIEALAFSEIREYPVYAFTFDVPMPEELPEVATYLREQVDTSAMEPAPITLEDPLVEYDDAD